jgi:hypothetical protein
MERLASALAEALQRSRELTLEPAPLTPRAHALLSDLSAWPAAQRVNRVSAKPTAEILVTSGEAPVLALHGRVAAATFALREGWAGGLAAWPGLSTLLQRLVRHVAPPAPGIASASARLEGGDIVFSVRRPGGDDAIEAAPVRLLRRGADLYEGRVRARPGTTVLRVAGRVVAACTRPHPQEYAALGADAASIERITATTGGRRRSERSDLDVLPSRGARGARPGRPVFLIAAMILFLAELVVAVFWR